MRITQGTFSFLPDLTEQQIVSQIDYCMKNGWSIGIEHTDDPHPRNSYWEMWDLPMFEVRDPATILLQISACRKALPNHYIKVNANNPVRGRETVALSFIVNRPQREPGFRLDRQEASGRAIRYTIHSYAADKPEGERYDGEPPDSGNGRG
ncbi:MAG: ribulose bisphosphate carboxylase small subunit [Bryobacteraceae bacterium]|jgi:ribulose-bisphosphate carboxylase small chain